MLRNDISAAPVADEYLTLLGILTERDVMRIILQAVYYHTPSQIVSDLMTPNPESVSPDDSIFDLARRLVEGPYRRFPLAEN